MYACLAVTCHLHFWQNDRDFLRATVVTRGWNGYRNKSQHRKSTLEKKILPPFQQGFEPATFQSRVRCSNHWAIPAPFWAKCRPRVFIALGFKAKWVTQAIAGDDVVPLQYPPMVVLGWYPLTIMFRLSLISYSGSDRNTCLHDLGNQHNNGPHQDRIFYILSALCLASLAQNSLNSVWKGEGGGGGGTDASSRLFTKRARLSPPSLPPPLGFAV